MSLDWNRTKCKDWKTQVELDGGTAVCDTMIWGSIPIGFNRITEENYIEIAARFSIYEGAFGAFISRHKDGEESVETIDYRGLKIKIFEDSEPIDPRTEFENVGTMVCWHKRYQLGDEQPKVLPSEYVRSSMDCVELPLYLLDHGGITISTKDFGDKWDSGQIGFIYISIETARQTWGFPADATWDSKATFNDGRSQTLREYAMNCMNSEVETYDQYLRGEVFGYEAGKDSCWGFFGDDHEASGLLDEARSAIDHAIMKNEKEADEYIPKIASRWVGEHYAPGAKMSVIMDLEVVQTLYPAFRWKELFESEEHDFAHDMIGINNNLNRDRKKMDNCFVPRFAH